MDRKFLIICEGEVASILTPGVGPAWEKITAIFASDPKIIELTDSIPNGSLIEEGWKYSDGIFSPPAE